VKIIVDQDEVLAQFVDKVLRRWNAINGTNFTRDQVTCWRMEEILGVDTLGRSAEGLIDEWMCEPGFFEDLDPVPGAIDGFNALRKLGHDVVVATSIPEIAINAFDGKRRWMRKRFPDWSMKNFIACSRKGFLEAEHIIDDGDHNIKDWTAAGRQGAIIFDAPWNQDVGIRLNNVFVERVKSWEEIVERFEREDSFQKEMAEVQEKNAKLYRPTNNRMPWR
jgi:5'(3')-deoxyribonucleotidase